MVQILPEAVCKEGIARREKTEDVDELSFDKVRWCERSKKRWEK